MEFAATRAPEASAMRAAVGRRSSGIAGLGAESRLMSVSSVTRTQRLRTPDLRGDAGVSSHCLTGTRPFSQVARDSGATTPSLAVRGDD